MVAFWPARWSVFLDRIGLAVEMISTGSGKGKV
jgi:hypothetical protein